jgi:flagellar export protein FliJ
MSPSPVCWNILARKAQSKLNERQRALALASQKYEQLSNSLERLQQLYQEYREQELSKAAASWDSHARLNHRQFMAQLSKVQDRLSREIELAGLARSQATQAVLDAQLELRKMNTLDEQQSIKLRAAHVAKEQRRLDELAMTRFNLGTS